MEGVFIFKTQVYPKELEMRFTHIWALFSFTKFFYKCIFATTFPILKNSINGKEYLFGIILVSEKFGNITQGL
jgi:hypothetical protein